jgi:hypothetical protein
VVEEKCPENPCVKIPRPVLAASIIWLVLLAAGFVCFQRIDAFADFVSFDLGPLPFQVIWFGAAGGWLISAQGIFNNNLKWKRSYDYWHYIRPPLGALIGTLGCLLFIVLNEAATTEQTAANPVFYEVIALTIGYREKNFRALITRLVDTVISPAEKEA